MESDLVEQRKKKLEELAERGTEAFPNHYKPSHTTAQLHSNYGDSSPEQLDELNDQFSLAGRVVAIRDFGKSAFFHITDRSGKIQGYLRNDVAGPEQLDFFKKIIDIGDIVGIKGNLFKTKTGELTVNIKNVELLTKSIRPPA